MTEKQILKWFSELPEYPDYVEAIGEYNKDLGYAGPEDNEFLSDLIPETAWGINLNLCFYQHDALCEIGGDKETRRLTDGSMLLTALFIIENTPDRWFLYGLNTIRRHLARLRILKYYEIVRSQGKPHFNFTVEGVD